jgi:hypothetical protein
MGTAKRGVPQVNLTAYGTCPAAQRIASPRVALYHPSHLFTALGVDRRKYNARREHGNKIKQKGEK